MNESITMRKQIDKSAFITESGEPHDARVVGSSPLKLRTVE